MRSNTAKGGQKMLARRSSLASRSKSNLPVKWNTNHHGIKIKTTSATNYLNFLLVRKRAFPQSSIRAYFPVINSSHACLFTINIDIHPIRTQLRAFTIYVITHVFTLLHGRVRAGIGRLSGWANVLLRRTLCKRRPLISAQSTHPRVARLHTCEKSTLSRHPASDATRRVVTPTTNYDLHSCACETAGFFHPALRVPVGRVALSCRGSAAGKRERNERDPWEGGCVWKTARCGWFLSNWNAFRVRARACVRVRATRIVNRQRRPSPCLRPISGTSSSTTTSSRTQLPSRRSSSIQLTLIAHARQTTTAASDIPTPVCQCQWSGPFPFCG